MAVLQKTILIVEDDQAVRESLLLWLTEFDWNADGVGSAAEALGFESPFDAYIIDLHLKDGDGFNLAEELRNRFGKIPIIIMSGYLDPELRNEAMSRGINAILKKPFHMEDVNRILTSILKKKRTR